MRPGKIAYFLVGLFVIVAVTGLVVVLSVLTGRGASTERYHTSFANVAGLKFGTPVFFEGFHAGQIEGIAPVESGTRTVFRIEISVLGDLQIPRDSEVDIVQPNLLSGRALSIVAGKSETLIPPGAEIPSGNAAGLAALPGLIGAGDQLINDARVLMDEATAAMAQVNQFVTHDLGAIAAEYQALPATLQSEAVSLASDLHDTIENANAVIGRTDAFLSQSNADSLSQTLANVEVLTTSLAESSADLAGIREDIKVITGQVRTMVADNKGDLEGTIVDLRYTMETIAERIDTLTYNMEGTSRNMYEFSRQIRLNPGLLLGGTAQSEQVRTGADQ